MATEDVVVVVILRCVLLKTLQRKKQEPDEMEAI